MSLADEELDQLTPLASALPPPARKDFLKLVANRLSGYPQEVRGPGLVHRLAVEAQREFLQVAVGPGRNYGRPFFLRRARR